MDRNLQPPTEEWGTHLFEIWKFSPIFLERGKSSLLITREGDRRNFEVRFDHYEIESILLHSILVFYYYINEILILWTIQNDYYSKFIFFAYNIWEMRLRIIELKKGGEKFDSIVITDTILISLLRLLIKCTCVHVSAGDIKFHSCN